MSAMHTCGLMLSFIPSGWNVVFKCQYLEAELLQVRQLVTIFKWKMYGKILRAKSNHDKVASPKQQSNEVSIYVAHNLHKLSNCVFCR